MGERVPCIPPGFRKLVFPTAFVLGYVTSREGTELTSLSTTISNYLVVSTRLKNISQIGSSPQVGVNIKHIWNQHLVKQYFVSKKILTPNPNGNALEIFLPNCLEIQHQRVETHVIHCCGQIFLTKGQIDYYSLMTVPSQKKAVSWRVWAWIFGLIRSPVSIFLPLHWSLSSFVHHCRGTEWLQWEGAVSKSLPIITGSGQRDIHDDYQAIGSIGVVIFVRYVPVKPLMASLFCSLFLAETNGKKSGWIMLFHYSPALPSSAVIVSSCPVKFHTRTGF